ncbi:hypothetical protein [Chitinophaga solisilvae]|uniref:hypothetical protein n=1 Tax=Chitinophaga solisilvae TaxID=1233460 RepID=UPI00136C1F82|nr:hypothetical protein [Chitinophaga solisilvae]
MGTNKQYASLMGRDEQLTTNTSSATYTKYNPNTRISFVLGFKNNVNITVMEAINVINASSQKINGVPELFTGQLLNKK